MNNPLFKKVIVVISLLFLVSLSSVSALTLTFQDASLAGPISFVVYNYTGDYVGTYNTTTGIVASLNDSSYIIRLRPDRTDYVSNPMTFLTDMSTFISGNMVALVIGCFAIGFLIYGSRRR